MGLGSCGGSRITTANGNEDHCCYINGEICPALTDLNGEPACGFMLASGGDWDAVYADPGYIQFVKPTWDARGIPDCGDWPEVGKTCGSCGLIGDANVTLSETSPGVTDEVIVALKTGDKNREKRELADRLSAWADAHP
jgi:hypothetical protein